MAKKKRFYFEGVEIAMPDGSPFNVAPPMTHWLSKMVRSEVKPGVPPTILLPEVLEWMGDNLTGSHEIVCCAWLRDHTLPSGRRSVVQRRYGVRFELERDLVLYKLWWA